MLQNIFIFIFILAVASFQTSFLPHFFSPERVPDLLMIMIIFWAVRIDFFRILIWVIVSGIVMDMLYFAPLGLNIFAFVLIVFVAGFLAKRMLVLQGNGRFLILLGLIVAGTFLNDWSMLFFDRLLYGSSFQYSFNLFLEKDIFFRVVYNLIVFALIYWPLVKLDGRFNLYNSRMRILK